MALVFPTNPSLNQTYSSGSSATYQWNGLYWDIITPPVITTLLAISASYALPSEDNWTTVGTIQAVGIGATTTAPTVPTNPVANSISYKKVGPKTHRVRGIYIAASSTTGGAGGSGDYLFTLPYGLQFDLTVPGQAAYASGATTNDANNVIRAIPGSNVIIGVPGGVNSAGWPQMIIPYDATRYRIGAFLFGNSTYCWQSGYQVITTNNLNARWEFEFQSL